MTKPPSQESDVLSPFADSHASLRERGYAVRRFPDAAPLRKAVEACRHVLREENLDGDLATYHRRVTDQQTHVRTVANLTSALQQEPFVEQLFRPEERFLQSLLGPDVVVQAAPHLRVGRPQEERDSIDLHRDSFYGSSIWHLNFWFPLVPLGTGSGILLAPGTHRQPSRNVRDKAFPDEFRSSVAKGSVENQLGFIYRRRTDDTIENLAPGDLTLVSPPLDSYVLFFGCMVHGGTNRSEVTRWTMDVRFSKSDDGSAVRPGYFNDFTRGLIRKVATDFHGRDQEKSQ